MNLKGISLAAAAATFAAAAYAGPGTLEDLKRSAEINFNGARALEAPAPVPMPDAQNPEGFEGSPLGSVLIKPVTAEVLEKGASLGSFKMSDRLDSHRHLFSRQFGSKIWDMSVAAGDHFKILYFSFMNPSALVFTRIGNLNDLLKNGVIAQIEPGTTYRIKATIDIFNPVRGTKVHFDPIDGTNGPSSSIKTGELMDAVKARSYVINAGGEEFWVLYGTDIDPATNHLANTRSLLFIREAGLSTKTWAVSEDQLAPGKGLQVQLGDQTIVLVRNSNGVLDINLPGNEVIVDAQ